MKNHYLLLLLSLFLTTTQAQTLTAISPNTGVAGTTVTAIVTGQNTFFMSGSPQGIQQFHLNDGNCHQINGANFVVLNDDSVQVDIAIPVNGYNGIYDVSVVTGNHLTLVLPSAFTVTGGLNVSLVTFSPSTVSENSVFTATISGQNLATLAPIPGFQIILEHSSRTLHGANVTSIGTDTLRVEFFVPAYSDTGYWNCYINYGGGCLRILNALHVTGVFPKQLISIAPGTGNAGTTLHALITGQNTFFQSASPQGSLKINSIVLTNANCNTYFGTSIHAIDGDHANVDFILPASASNGVYDVTVNLISGVQLTLSGAFTITNGIDRSVTACSPSTANAGTTLTATISGQGLADIISHLPVTITLKNSFGLVITSTVYSMSGNQLMANFTIPPFADSGYCTLKIISGAGCYTLDSAVFIINPNPPVLVSIVPNHGLRNETLTAVITGSNTFFLSGSPSNDIYDVKFRHTVTTTYTFDVLPPNIHQLDSIHVSLDMHVPASALLGFYDVEIYRTNSATIILDSAFEVRGTLVSGRVFYDANMDGLFNAGDSYLPNEQIRALPDNVTTTSNALGNYYIGVEQGIDTIEVLPLTNWICTTPCSYIINVGANDTTGFDFGLMNTTSIDEIHNPDQLLIYPNPTDGFFRFELPEHKLIDGTALVVDQTGRVIRRMSIHSDKGEIDLGNYATGIYTVVLVTDDGMLRSRVVVY